MNTRQVVTRCGLAAALIPAPPPAKPRPPRARLRLRYHFTAGQTIGYLLSQTATITATQAGLLLPGEQDRSSALEQYRFLSVDPAGVHAKLLIHTSKATQTAHQAGKVWTVRPTVPDQQFTLSRDGWAARSKSPNRRCGPRQAVPALPNHCGSQPYRPPPGRIQRGE